MNRSNTRRILPVTLVLMWLGHAAFAQATHPSKGSAASSRPSAINAPASNAARALAACDAAADNLAATRRLADALESENRALRERLDTEKRTTHLLGQMNEARIAETDALRTALAARNAETDAKHAVIEKQAELIAVLKQKRTSQWRRIGDLLIGAAAALILK